MGINARGFTLIETIMVMGMLGIVGIAGFAILDSQTKANAYFQKKTEALEARALVQRSMANADLCGCHLVPSLTVDTGGAAQLRVDTTNVSGTGSFPIPRLRADCTPASQVLFEVGQRINHVGRVAAITMANLRPTGVANQWQGKWRITFQPESNQAPTAPIEVAQSFFLDPTTVTATPSAASIDRCAGGAPPVGAVTPTSCPTGMVVVGTEGQIGSYCIDENERAPTSFLNAKYVCSQMPTGFGPAKMCDYGQWRGGCDRGVGTNFTGNWEWIADNSSGGAITVGGSGCASDSSDYLGGSRPYRCCIR